MYNVNNSNTDKFLDSLLVPDWLVDFGHSNQRTQGPNQYADRERVSATAEKKILNCMDKGCPWKN